MDKWTIIFNEGRKVRGISITEKILVFLIIFFFILTGGFTYIIYEGTKKKTLVNDYLRLKNGNQRYIKKLEKIRESFTVIESRLGNMGEKNTILMMVGGVEPVNAEVKKMGVGGFPSKREFYSSGVEQITNEVESDVNRVRNLTELELVTYNNANKKVRSLNERLSHTPSIWPTYGWVTDGYGWRIHPVTRKRQFHKGFDIANRSGTPVIATADGVVSSTKWRSGYGKTVVIKHGYGLTTRYAHLSRIYVRVGQSVERGQRIGTIGSTGITTGPHLHYEVRVLGRTVDPYNYLDNYKKTY